jgi:hypothetical protein
MTSAAASTPVAIQRSDDEGVERDARGVGEGRGLLRPAWQVECVGE